MRRPLAILPGLFAGILVALAVAAFFSAHLSGSLWSLVGVTGFCVSVAAIGAYSWSEGRALRDGAPGAPATTAPATTASGNTASGGERSYRRLIDDATIAMLLADADSCEILAANASALRLLGNSIEAAGTSIRPTDPALGEALASIVSLARSGSATAEALEVAVAAGGDGSTRWVEPHCTPVHGAGRPLVHVILLDVTARRHASEQLLDNEHRYRTLFELSPNGILLEDERGAILDVNPAFCDASGYTREEIVGRSVASLVPENQREQVTSNIQRVLAGEDLRGPVRSLRKDGTEHVLELHETSYPLRGGGQGILVISHDISERMKQEQEVRRYAMIFETMKDGVAAFDRDGRIAFCNPAMALLVGLPMDALVGRRGADVWNEAALGDGLAGSRTIVESRLVRSDGAERMVSVRRFSLTGQPPLEVAIYRDITQRKRAEEALQRSEAFNRAVLSSLTAKIAVLDAAGQIVGVNRAWDDFAQGTGNATVSRHLVGKNYLEVGAAATQMAPEHVAEMVAGVRTVISGQRALFTMEYATHGPTRRRWFMLSAAPLADKAGGAVISHLNITERKLAEEAVRRSEEQHRLLMQNLGDGVALVGPDETFEFSNPAGDSIFGVPRGSLVGRNLMEFVDPREHELLTEKSRSRARGATDTYRLGIVRPDGTRRIITVNANPRFDPDSGAFVGTLGIFRDDTERVRAEEGLARELAFSSVVEDLGHAINGNVEISTVIRKVCEAVVSYCAVPSASLLHFSSSEPGTIECLGTGPAAAGLPPTVRWEQLGPECAMRKIVESGTVLIVEDTAAEADTPLVSEGGSTGYRALLGIPVKAHGEVLGALFALAAEPTEWRHETIAALGQFAVQAGAALSNARLFGQLRRRNTELNDTIAQLQAAERERDQFYRFLVHDINKPLAAIIGTAARLTGTTTRLPGQAYERAMRIDKAANRLRELVGQFLEHETIRRGDVSTKPSRFDVVETIVDTARFLADRLGDRELLVCGQSADATGGRPAIEVWSDHGYVSRIIQNLLDNAIKYGDHRIRVDAALRDGVARIGVWNDGRPIPEEDRERIFEEFFRRPQTAAAEGYGIGLSSARRLLTLLGGRIWTESPPDGGVLFVVELPTQSTATVPRPPA